MLEPCYVCRHARPTAWQVAALQAVVCDGCVSAVGQLILSGGATGLPCWLEAPSQPSAVLANDTLLADSEEHPATQVDLAIAYLEVGLVSDALEAAAQALLLASAGASPAVSQALDIVFSPAAFRAAQVGQLRGRLFPG